MSAPHPHFHIQDHQGLVPTDQLGASPGTLGYVLVDQADGTAAFAPGAATPPASLARLLATMDADITAIGDDTWTYVSFDTASVVGTDVEVDGGDATTINILTDGKYGVTGWAAGALDVPSDAIQGDVILAGLTGNLEQAGQPSAEGYYSATIDSTRFLSAGATIRVQMRMTGGAWSLFAGSGISVERVA